MAYKKLWETGCPPKKRCVPSSSSSLWRTVLRRTSPPSPRSSRRSMLPRSNGARRGQPKRRLLADHGAFFPRPAREGPDLLNEHDFRVRASIDI